MTSLSVLMLLPQHLQLKAARQSHRSSTICVLDSTDFVSQSGNNQNLWIIGSGASDHIAGNRSLFSSISSPKFPHFITLVDGSKVVAKGIVHVSVTPSITLKSVLLPGCPFNIISIHQLTCSLNCLDTFDAGSFTIQERGTGRMIGEGHESHGLYYLQSTPSVSCIAAESPNLLHERLGHPSLLKLKKMVPNLAKISSLKCESCQLGKHARSSFPSKVESRVDSPFFVIHSDIWGPNRVASNGFRYFVTFIDEFFRCTWVFLMKERSELLPILTTFVNEVKTQFGKTIKILRSDNAKEYFSSGLSSFLSAHGILHQSSCPHTPQQNDIAERKNRHLVETARTLLLHANVPLQHWGEAVLTSCFLINRMPSSAVDHKIPHSILFPKEPLFHVAPRIFVCTCFVHDLSPGLHKLSARAIKCVFLGYSRLQIGYKCYSPVHNRYYISADVTFFEEKLYFSPSTVESHTIQEVFPIPYLGPSPSPIPESVLTTSIPDNPPLDQSQRSPIVYRRRPHVVTELENIERSYESCPTPEADPTTKLLEENLNLPIAIRKGTRSTCNPHPIYNFLSYHRLSPSYYSFVSSIFYFHS